MKLPILFMAAARIVAAQHVTVPQTCVDGFEAGTSVVIYTVPHPYDQVMSVIGSYKNITWSGNKPSTVSLNGTDNHVGTARSYTTPRLGAYLVETITEYSKPSNGPYVEIHTTALFTVAALNVEIYMPFDGTIVKDVCGGRASRFNFTSHFCATDRIVAQKAIDEAHLTDAATLGKLLGGRTFTSCAALKKQDTRIITLDNVSTPLPMLAATIGVAGATLVAALCLM